MKITLTSEAMTYEEMLIAMTMKKNTRKVKLINYVSHVHRYDQYAIAIVEPPLPPDEILHFCEMVSDFMIT